MEIKETIDMTIPIWSVIILIGGAVIGGIVKYFDLEKRISKLEDNKSILDSNVKILTEEMSLMKKDIHKVLISLTEIKSTLKYIFKQNSETDEDE